MEQIKAGKKSGWMIIGLLFFLSIINVADKSIIGLASVPIMKELGLTPTQWGLVGSAFFWLFSISAITVGWISDYVGTKKVITVIASVWAVIQFATLFVFNLPSLILTRILLGAGEGPTYGLSMTMASKNVPKERIGLGLTLVSVGNTVGAAIAAPILLFIINSYGWRSGFIFMGIVGIIWLLFWILFAKDDSTKAVKEAVLPEKKGSSTSWTEFLPILFSKNFLLTSLCCFGSYWFFSVELAWFPNYFQQARGINGTMLSIAIMLPWLTTTLSQIFFSSWSDRLYMKTKSIVRSRVFIIGPMVVAAAACYYLATLVSSNALAVTLLCLAVALRSIIMVLGPAMITNMYPKKHYGKAQGSFTAIYYLAGIIAPFATGVIIQSAAQRIDGFNNAFQIGSGLLLVCGLLFWIFVRPKDQAVVESQV